MEKERQMGKPTLTHIGVIESDYLGTPKKYRVKLRKTKRFWITEKGKKYRLNGSELVEWPHAHLIIESIKPI